MLVCACLCFFSLDITASKMVWTYNFGKTFHSQKYLSKKQHVILHTLLGAASDRNFFPLILTTADYSLPFTVASTHSCLMAGREILKILGNWDRRKSKCILYPSSFFSENTKQALIRFIKKLT